MRRLLLGPLKPVSSSGSIIPVFSTSPHRISATAPDQMYLVLFVKILTALELPKVNAIFHMWPSQCFSEWNNHFPQYTVCRSLKKIVSSQAQDLIFVFVEFHEVHINPFIQSVEVLLNGSSVLPSLELSPDLTRLHPISSSRWKILNRIKDIEWPQNWPLRNSANWQNTNH